jgi:Ca-activated chloride channel family protein
MKIETRLDHPTVPAGAPSLVHILLTLTAPDQSAGRTRPPLNVAAVIDRSGSMAGEKLDYAKQSVKILVDQLGPRDRFSLVTFDDEVLPLVEGARTGDKTRVKELIDGIESGGSTNLSGGWIKGIELVSRESAAEGQVNAVLLLTDGQANQGIIDHPQLVALGESVQREKGIRTTCLGLGGDFDEDLLKSIATAAGGRFYYIESPDHAPEVFKEELGGLLAVVAQNVELALAFADGVTGVAQLTGHSWKQEGADCRLILGDFHAGQVKHALLLAQLPALPDLSDVLVAFMQMTYAEMKKGSIEIRSQKHELIVRTVDAGAEAAPCDPEVLLHIGIQSAAKARQAAVQELDKGDVPAAMRVLEAQRDKLRGMAPQACDPRRLNNEADQLDRRAKELRDEEDIKGSRKFMVSEGNALSQTNFCIAESSRVRRSRSRPATQSTPTKGAST